MTIPRRNLRPPGSVLAAATGVQRALTSLPYGAGAHFDLFDLSGRPGAEEGTVDDVLAVIEENLIRLREVLRRAAEQDEAHRAELFEIHGDFAAAGRLLGRILSVTAEALERESDGA